jgi:NAD(P)-dependent dehydrogenase (short-subunit alcohol dehydrogenase family)
MATIVVTGCDTGLGVEFVRQYAAEGHRVLATCLDPATAHDTRAVQGNVEVLKLDVTDHGDIAALGRHLAGAPVDIFVNNAGIGRPHPPFGQTDYDNWRRILETNLIGPMKLAETLVDNIAASELKMMAFVSSRMGSIALNNSGGSYAYRSSKAGLNMMVKGLAVDLAPRQISVIALHPGWAATEPGGRVPVAESVSGMRGVIHRAGRHHTGIFQTYHDQPLPW